MGATEDGQKELLAIVDGYRESEQSWTELLLDVKARGLTVDPKLATGDGALGFWKALPKAFPKTKAQRCWFHKSGNVIDKLPKRLQAAAESEAARHLDGRHPRARPGSLRLVHRHLPGQVS